MTRYAGGTLAVLLDEELAAPYRGACVRVRVVDALAEVLDAERAARDEAHIVIRAMHGGTVANAYKYRAETDLCVILTDGELTVVWRGEAPANKTTLCGACVRSGAEELAPLFDGRVPAGHASRYLARAWGKQLLTALRLPDFPAAYGAAQDVGKGRAFLAQITTPIEAPAEAPAAEVQP